MRGKAAFLIRAVLALGIGLFLVKSSGLFGFIDMFQLAEVFVGMVLTAMVIRVFCQKGMIYIAEYTALVCGILFMGIGMILMWLRYEKMTVQMVSINTISLFYGLCFSLLSTAVVWKHRHKKRERRG